MFLQGSTQGKAGVKNSLSQPTQAAVPAPECLSRDAPRVNTPGRGERHPQARGINNSQPGRMSPALTQPRPLPELI